MLVKTGILMSLGLLLTAAVSPGVSNIDAPASPATDSVAPPSACMIENTAFQDGEEVVYKVFYNWNFVWLAAGEITFRVKDLGDKFHLSVIGRTYKAYEWFYKVRDRYDTYIDKETLLPLVSIRDVNEGKYRLYDKITFDHRRNKARSLRGKSKETAELTEYDIESCMHDLLSIIYYARNINYSALPAGTKLPIKIFIDKETWPLQVHYKGKEEKKRVRGMGKFKAVKFSPEVISGHYFRDGTEMNVWVSDDKNHIPLLIESPVSVGSVKVVLKEYKGLRYDLDAAL